MRWFDLFGHSTVAPVYFGFVWFAAVVLYVEAVRLCRNEPQRSRFKNDDSCDGSVSGGMFV